MTPPPIPVSLGEIALRYHADGWHPLSLPALAKAPPPDDRTGYGGSDLTVAEIKAIHWAGNIGLRMPADVLGLDVDVYKGGGETLAALIAKCGPLPPTWISHSLRNDGSGIRFYRVPIMAWITGLPGIEIIQRVHRYAVVYPSIHPDGRAYGWVDQAEQEVNARLPVVEDDLPELPWPWIEELSRAQQSDLGAHSRAVNGDAADTFLDGHNRADQPGSIGPILAEFTQKWRSGYSRHDAMQHCLIWAMEYVRAELAAGRPTVTLFGDLWVEAVSPNARRAELRSNRRTTEFQGMLRHAVGKVLVKSEADMHKLHDEHALPIAPGSVPAGSTDEPTAEAPSLLTPPELIRFRELPDPFVVPVVTWLAENLLCRDTHGELAGAEKSFKSYLGLTLDVGLAAGIDVLGHFPVAERQRVLVLIGEGGEGPFLRRLAEVCAGYGIMPARLRGWLRYTTDHASASSLRFLDGIAQELESFEPALVHLDPWYTYQPAATESGQLTSVGATLERVGEVCRQGGATALINHHFNRGANGGLRQITGAGHAEWVDSWLLSRHRVAPNLTDGFYRLRLDVGSRQWGGASYDVDFKLIDVPISRLSWTVRVAVDDDDNGEDPYDRYKVALLTSGRAHGKPQIRTAWIGRTRGDDKKLRTAFDELKNDGTIVPGPAPNTWLPIALPGLAAMDQEDTDE
jgi:hypothetical protein